MTIVVLLAAGESSRTTGMKQLYMVDGEYLINKQIKKIQSLGYEVVVILGHEFDKISSVIEKDIKIIQNNNYKDGMFSSVKRSFELLDADKLIFCHIDRPIPNKNIFESLIKSNSPIATSSYKEKKAPPIMIKSSMKKELLDSDAKRLDFWIQNTKKAKHIEVDDEKVHFNANTDEELRRYFG